MIGVSAHRRQIHRWPWYVAIGLLFFVLQSAPASAHASLIGSDPANEAVLLETPSSLTLTFNETVEPLVMRIIDRDGAISTVSRIERRGANLVLMPPKPLAAGAYILSWRVISDDGHPVGGALTFWIGTRSTPARLASADNASVRFAIWAARMIVAIGLFAGAGGAFFLAWIKLPASIVGPRAVIAATSAAGLAALAVSIGLQGLDALGVPLSALATPAVWTTGARGSFGWSVVIAALALIAGLLSRTCPAGPAKIMSLLALVAVGLAFAASGHAANADPRALAGASVVLHGISLAFWTGALVPLAFALRQREAVLPLMRFSRAIPFAVATLLASGLVLAVMQLQHLEALWTTSYGYVLLTKLVLVALLLAVALWNRMSLTPKIAAGRDAPRHRLRHSIICEMAVVVVILGIVGLWRFTPPPRLLAAMADDFFVHLHTEQAMANVTIVPGRAGPVEIIVQLETPDEQPLAAMAVSVTLSMPEKGIEPITVEAQRDDSGRWHARTTASIAGRWSLGLGILVSDFEKVSIEAPILVK